MSGHADTIRDALGELSGNSDIRFGHDSDRARYEANAALDSLLVERADRIAWLEGEVAGWRIKLAECEERREQHK